MDDEPTEASGYTENATLSQDFFEEIIISSARPYNSSKVCFDLNPRYADASSGPVNARHEEDGQSFLHPKVWHERNLCIANRFFLDDMALVLLIAPVWQVLARSCKTLLTTFS